MPTPPPRDPFLLLIGTGGTIAGVAPGAGDTTGYQAGALSLQQVLATVPGLDALLPGGTIVTEQYFSIPSEEMTGQHWLLLAHQLRQWLQPPADGGHGARPVPQAIVITHGTDTLEETAFFLSLVLPQERPVLLTGAMRPASALSADGPANLFDSCRLALAAHRAGVKGTFVCMGGQALRADAVYKRHANQVQAFGQRFGQPAGWLQADHPDWQQPPSEQALQGAFAHLPLPAARIRGGDDGAPESSPPAALPKVALVQQHVDTDPAIIGWLLTQGYRGLILAGTGAGTLPSPMRAALARARQQGCLVVRASRLPEGYIGRNTDANPADRDDALDFIASGWLDASKSRILLQLCLMADLSNTQTIQALFDRCRP